MKTFVLVFWLIIVIVAALSAAVIVSNIRKKKKERHEKFVAEKEQKLRSMTDLDLKLYYAKLRKQSRVNGERYREVFALTKKIMTERKLPLGSIRN